MGFHSWNEEFRVPGPASTTSVKINNKTEDGITHARGLTKPTDAAAGYAPGCIFEHSDGTTATSLYVNEGSVTSCDFNAVVTAENLATAASSAQVANAVDGDELVVRVDAEATAGTAAGAGPSPLIWDTSQLLAVMLDPTLGYYYFNDYLDEIDVTTADGYVITTVNSGALTASVTEDGGALFVDSAGNNAADDGIQVQLTNCLFKPVAGRTIRFEARVKMNDTSALISQFAIGLAGVDTTLIAAGVIDDVVSKCLWFRHGATTADKMSVCTARTSAEDIDADKATVADATYIKLGFVIDGLTSVKWYADGVLVHTSSVAANIGNDVMCLSYVSQTEGASKDSELTIDWVRILSEGARTA